VCSAEAAPEDLPALLGSVTFITASHCIQLSQRLVVDAGFHYIFGGLFLLFFLSQKFISVEGKKKK